MISRYRCMDCGKEFNTDVMFTVPFRCEDCIKKILKSHIALLAETE